MKTLIIASAFLLSACQTMPPACSGTVRIGGQDTTVQVYGVRKVAKQTQYRAGYPFNWQWISAANFKDSTCGEVK